MAKPCGHIITNIESCEGRKACMAKLPQEGLGPSKSQDHKGSHCAVFLELSTHIYG